MLSLQPIKSSAQAAHYFMETDNYYMSEKEGQSLSEWWGEGAKRLGLEGQVDAKTFTEILEGKLPNGEIIGLQKDGTIKHRPGYDLTFSAPKSFSIISSVFGKEVCKKFMDKALNTVLTEVERIAAQARFTKGDGEVGFEQTNNLIVALHKHETSRELDPQDHVHCVVMNATERSDGKWRALASDTTAQGVPNGFYERILNNQIYFSTIFRSTLAKELVDHGFSIEITGRHGMFEIKGFPKEVLEHFSKRRQQIKAQIDELGLTSSKQKEVATLNTRRPKEACDHNELRDYWKKELETLGHTEQSIMDKVHTAAKEPDKMMSTANAKEALEHALEHCADFKNALGFSEVLTKAMEFSIGNVTHKDLVGAFNQMLANKEVIPLEGDKITTQKLIDTETRIIDSLARSAKTDRMIKVKEGVLDKITESEQLQSVVKKALGKDDRLCLIQNEQNPRELLHALLNAAEHSGQTVKILSPTGVSAGEVANTIKRDPQNLWQWLMTFGKEDVGQSVKGFLYRYEREINTPLSSLKNGKEVIIVEHAERLSKPDIEKLTELTEKREARVIFVHDKASRESDSTAINLLNKAHITTHHLKAGAKESSLHATVSEMKDDDARALAVAYKYLGCPKEQRDQSMVVAHSRTAVQALNKTIREGLRDQGELGRLEIQSVALHPVSMSNTEKKLAGQYQSGQVIRMFDQQGQSKDYRLVKVLKEDNELIALSGKEKIRFNPKKYGGEIQTFEPKMMQYAEGDKLIALGSIPALKIKNGTAINVISVTDKGVMLSDGVAKPKLLRIEDLQGLPLDYHYATTPQKLAKCEHIIADIKGYALNADVVSHLQNSAKSSVSLYTDKPNKSTKHLQAEVTAIDTLMRAVDRQIDAKTLDSMKSDIEKALTKVFDIKDQKISDQAVAFAIEKLTERDAAFKHVDLVTEALVFSMGKTDRKEILEAIHQKQKDGELVLGEHFADGTRWTTKEAISLEQSIVDTVQQGKGKVASLVEAPKATDMLMKNQVLKPGQKDACHMILSTADRFVAVQGYAGTGKTTMLNEVKEAMREEMLSMIGQVKQALPPEIKMIAVAPTHKAVSELKQRGIEAQTLKSFLVDQANEKNDNKLSDKLIILDESSMVGNKDFAKFLQVVETKESRAVLVGDKAQLSAIESGKPFEVLQNRKVIQVAEMKDILRQQEAVLKSGVEKTIAKDYKGAFETIEKQDINKHIIRDRGQSELFEKIDRSIIESKDSQVPIKEMVAYDYLSRTESIRDKTVVIVHAHEDRSDINKMIRSGLQDQGVVGANEYNQQKLTNLSLEKAELKRIEHYAPGMVVKVGQEFYKIKDVDKTSGIVELVDQDGKARIFNPKRDINDFSGLYALEKMPVASGDKIRLTYSDKQKGRESGFEYQVESVNKDSMHLISPEGKSLELSNDKLKDAHWDYAYTVTGYGIQGGTKPYTIDFQMSYRKNLANQRGFYVAITRAQYHATIYTDNKDKLLQRITKNLGDKHSALDAITAAEKPYNPKDRAIDHPQVKTEVSKPGQKVHQSSQAHVPKEPMLDAKAVYQNLLGQAEVVVENILGKRNQALSHGNSWRYGSKGSLSIQMAGDHRGLWNNFETGEKGNLFGLIQSHLGLGFKEALDYAANITGDKWRTQQGSKVQAVQKPVEKAPEESRSAIYAKQLVAESKPIEGTLVETYLKETRRIEHVAGSDLRYHPHVSTGNKTFSPAMLAVVKDADGVVKCVQATYLDPETKAKANLDIKKRTYGSPKGGAIIQDSKDPNKLSILAEGVETAMSLRDVMPNDQIITTLGKSNYKNVDPAILGKTVVICLDNDGKDPTKDPVITKAVEQFQAAGKEVIVTMPKEIGADFNDVLKQGGRDAVTTLLKQDFERNAVIKNPMEALKEISANLRNIDQQDIAGSKVKQYTQSMQGVMQNAVKSKQVEKTPEPVKQVVVDHPLQKMDREIY